ncbi:MAG: LysR family transcriptional regulator [Methyloligellaceae bacterium]
MDQLTAMRVFRRVVELQGFSAAARDLGLSNAAVSKNVSELEAHLGTRLLNRTTRRMSLTEPGQGYYQRCVRILEDIEDADLAMSQLQAAPRGTLRVSAPMSFGLLHLAPAIPAYLQRYSEVSVDLVMNDRVVDLVDEGFDVAIRIGSTLADSSMISRRLAPVHRVVCGAPGYFEDRGVPRTPDDLRDHHCLVYSLASSPRLWRFTGADGATAVEIAGRYQVNSSIALRDALMAGLGVTLIPTFIVGEELKRGTLRAVLTDWQAEPQARYAIYPHNRHLSPKVRSFVDFLVERFGSTP